MKRCAIYVRVSSREQDYQRQLEELRTLAVRWGFDLVGEYSEAASTVYKAGKVYLPERESLLLAAARKEFDVILIHEFSRFGRSMVNTLAALEQLADYKIPLMDRNGQRIAMFEDGSSDPMAKLLPIFMSWAAEMERYNIGERVRSGLKHRREAKGLPLGRPDGLKWATTAKKEKEILKLHKQGYSMTKIQKMTRSGWETVKRVVEENKKSPE
jgi:DNA invertase Pin-like site-specific DNA recombinase